MENSLILKFVIKKEGNFSYFIILTNSKNIENIKMFQLKAKFQAQGVFETATKIFCTKNPHSQRLGVWRKKSRVPPEGDALCVCARHGCRRVKDAVYLTSRLS